jgi:hypothetical protein
LSRQFALFQPTDVNPRNLSLESALVWSFKENGGNRWANVIEYSVKISAGQQSVKNDRALSAKI